MAVIKGTFLALLGAIVVVIPLTLFALATSLVLWVVTVLAFFVRETFEQTTSVQYA